MCVCRIGLIAVGSMVLGFGLMKFAVFDLDQEQQQYQYDQQHQHDTGTSTTALPLEPILDTGLATGLPASEATETKPQAQGSCRWWPW